MTRINSVCSPARLCVAVLLGLAGSQAGAAPPGAALLSDGQETTAPVIRIPVLRPDQPPADPAFLEQDAEAKPSRTLQQKLEGTWGSWNGQVVVRDSNGDWEDPVPAVRCRTDETVRLELAGPLFVFTQLGAGSESTTAQQLTAVGQTGLGWKLSPGAGSELLVRGGPVLSCSESVWPEPFQGHSELKVEVQYSCPLPGPLRLEYQGSATPALAPTEHARVNQDLRFAVPLGQAGQFRVGAKHNWQNLSAPSPWTTGVELYVGVSLGR